MAPAQGWHAKSWSVPYFLFLSLYIYLRCLSINFWQFKCFGTLTLWAIQRMFPNLDIMFHSETMAIVLQHLHIEKCGNLLSWEPWAVNLISCQNSCNALGNHEMWLLKNLHRPGIEPGPPARQASILPLNQRCICNLS